MPCNNSCCLDFIEGGAGAVDFFEDYGVNDHDQTHAKFYRDLVNRGLGEGYAVVAAALTSDDEIVATVLGIRREDYIVFLRISNAGKRWPPCTRKASVSSI
jgi:hypothetical protein